MPRRSLLVILCLIALSISACQSAYYKTMQTFGKEKRDILIQRVKDSKKDQEQAKEKLQTTMESFQELTGFQGGSLEKSYKKLNGEYEQAQDKANKLHDRIKSIDQVSNDLFSEWQKEIDQMGNAKLKSQSSALLRDAKQRQSVFMKAMNKTEDQMTPVLNSFRDQVFFLKHNLNARAIGSLKGTSAKINTDVTTLMKSIDSSMQEADKLISSLSAPDDAKP
jgi:DNA repair exonuclease SbcCD ATPase subunit